MTTKRSVDHMPGMAADLHKIGMQKAIIEVIHANSNSNILHDTVMAGTAKAMARILPGYFAP